MCSLRIMDSRSTSTVSTLVSTLAYHILSLLFVIIAVATTSSVDDLTSLASCITAFIP